MDTLPLPAILGLQVEVESQSVVLKSPQSQASSFTVAQGFRRIEKESISFTQYVTDVMSVRTWLIAHKGQAFIWAYTGKAYYWTKYSIDYKEDRETTITGDVSLTLMRATNYS